MAPRQTGKRAAEASAAEPPAKRLAEQLRAQGVTKANFQAILEVVEHPLVVGEFPEDCRKMLTSGLPHSICVPMDERHEHQAMVVKMIGDVVDFLQAKLRDRIAEEASKVAKADDRKAGLERKVNEVLEQQRAAEETLQVKKDDLASTSKAFLAAKADTEAAKKAQEAGDKGVEATRAERESLRAAVDVAFAKLFVGEAAPEETEGFVKVLVDTATRLALDESLLLALPASLQKAPGARGMFGEMVFEQLRTALTTRLAALEQDLDAAAPAAAARAAEVEAAVGAEARAKEAHASSANDVSIAQQAFAEVTEALNVAKAELEGHEPAVQAASEARDARMAELDQFKEYNLVCFETLRDRLSAKRRKELAEEARKKAAAERAEKAAEEAREAEAAKAAEAAEAAKAAEAAEAAKATEEAQASEAAKTSEEASMEQAAEEAEVKVQDVAVVEETVAAPVAMEVEVAVSEPAAVESAPMEVSAPADVPTASE